MLPSRLISGFLWRSLALSYTLSICNLYSAGSVLASLASPARAHSSLTLFGQTEARPEEEMITSPSNQHIALLRSLHTSKGRTDAGLFLIEGPHVLEAVLDAR